MVMWVLKVSDNTFTWDKKFKTEAQGNMLFGSINEEEYVTWNFDEQVKTCFLYSVENGVGRRFSTLDLDPDTISTFSLLSTPICYLTESLVLLRKTPLILLAE